MSRESDMNDKDVATIDYCLSDMGAMETTQRLKISSATAADRDTGSYTKHEVHTLLTGAQKINTPTMTAFLYHLAELLNVVTNILDSYEARDVVRNVTNNAN